MWRKSSYSATNGNCVEVKPFEYGGVIVRDSKHPEGPALYFTQEEWDEFLARVKQG